MDLIQKLYTYSVIDNHFHKIKLKKTVLVAVKFGFEVYNVFIEDSNAVFLYKFKYVSM